jgi:hypothetical protein
MAAGMMRAEATQNQDLDTDKLMKILGKYYQLRDDYNDLVPVENVYTISFSKTRSTHC